jgi:hypothetical protein
MVPRNGIPTEGLGDMSKIGGVVIAGVLAVGGIGAYEKWGKGGEDNTVRDQSGEIVEQGELGVFVLSVGDCFIAGVGELASTTGVPCSSSHNNELAGEFTLIADVFPGDTSMESQADTNCPPLISSYVGDVDKVYLRYPNFTWRTILPTIESFAEGDRTVYCVLVIGDIESLSESLRNF